MVYRELLSVGEETVISPTWRIDLGGCSLRCLFCSEWAQVVQPHAAPALRFSADWFLPHLYQRNKQGARTISFVGGDPTVSLVAVLEVLAQVPDDAWLPVVWHCNGWLSDEARALLAPVVETWAVDVKFGNPQCAQRLAGVDGLKNDREVTRTLEFARSRGLLLRHLALPGHLACCTRPVVAKLRRDYPEIPLNLRSHYLPLGPARTASLARVPELKRLLSDVEMAELVSLGADATASKRQLEAK